MYNASFDEALARPAKAHLLQCMNALKEMEVRSLSSRSCHAQAFPSD